MTAKPAPSPGGSPADEYLQGHLRRLRYRLGAAIEARHFGDDPDAEFRGLFVTPEQALRLLEPHAPLKVDDSDHRVELEAWADNREAAGHPPRLRIMARASGLDGPDLDILLFALGPDLDPRFEQLYGFLHDDLTRRRPSIGLVIDLCGADLLDDRMRARFRAESPLLANDLVMVEDTDRAFLTRTLRVPDSVAAFLLGGDATDELVRPLVTSPVYGQDYDTGPVTRALDGGIRLFYLRDRTGAAALSYAASALRAAGRSVLALDLRRMAPGDDPRPMAAAACRQARLEGAGVIAGPVEALAEQGPLAVRAFAEDGGLVVLIGSQSWDPLWSLTPPLCLNAPSVAEPLDPRLAFRLTPEQAELALVAAGQQAVAEGIELSLEHLSAGARQQNAAGLDRLAVHIAPRATWEDLVVDRPLVRQLEDLLGRVQHRRQVLYDWGLSRGATKGEGVTALFSGDSGTGKTLAAEVVAHALGMDLYVIDLSTVVDKYIGETEKNLDRIFREADRVNGVLLFDEADALFGKRSGVQDARDRYANVEVSYLLQRMERFDGLAVLTTNLRANIDPAFLRRLDALLEFPLPDEETRARIWARHLPAALPRDPSVDIEFLAAKFDLTGGNIRNIALSAAFLAASEGSPLTMSTLIRATAAEYRKLGRLRIEDEFGPYYELLAAEADGRA